MTTDRIKVLVDRLILCAYCDNDSDTYCRSCGAYICVKHTTVGYTSPPTCSHHGLTAKP